MQKLKEIKTNLKKIIDTCTDFFSKTVVSKNIAYKFIPAYVLLLNKYYKFLYIYKVNKFLFLKKETPKLSNLDNILLDINKCIEVINKSENNFDFKTINSALLDTKKGGYQTEVFYNEIISKMEDWTLDTPKNKILKHLEMWTGEKNEKAILKSVILLKHNSNLLFDKVLATNNLNEYTNKIISNICKDIFFSLFKYYIQHRDKYLPEEGINESRKITDTKKEFKISFKDGFLNLDFNYVNCDFEYFVPECKKIIAAITKIDHKAAIKMLNMLKDTNQQYTEKDIIGYRKKLKEEIISILDYVSEDLKCETSNVKIATDINNFNSNSENFTKVIIPLVHSIIKAEKIIKEEIHVIKENLKIQTINLNNLKDKIYILIGPSTDPCVKKFVFASIKKIKKMNAKQIKEFVKSNL